jgi:hypothetical protein
MEINASTNIYNQQKNQNQKPAMKVNLQHKQYIMKHESIPGRKQTIKNTMNKERDHHHKRNVLHPHCMNRQTEESINLQHQEGITQRHTNNSTKFTQQEKSIMHHKYNQVNIEIKHDQHVGVDHLIIDITQSHSNP